MRMEKQKKKRVMKNLIMGSKRIKQMIPKRLAQNNKIIKPKKILMIQMVQRLRTKPKMSKIREIKQKVMRNNKQVMKHKKLEKMKEM